METVKRFITLKEMAIVLGRDRTTVYRWLRKKGIVPVGRSVSLSDLETKWPDFANALRIRQAERPACPSCKSKMCFYCLVCDESVA